ncbi:MAG: PIN domain-containing protein [Bryobacteraceae bacterium]
MKRRVPKSVPRGSGFLRGREFGQIVRETAERYSEIRSELKAAGTPIPANDLWIAALVRHRHMRLVTRDGHFRGIRGIHTLSW